MYTMKEIESKFPLVEEVSSNETFFWPANTTYKVPLKLEPPFQEIFESTFPEYIIDSTHLETNAGYRLCVLPDGRDTVCLWYLDGHDNHDIIKGFYHSLIIRSFLEANPKYFTNARDTEYDALMKRSKELLDASFGLVVNKLIKDGWDVEHSHLADDHRRIRFYSSEMKK